MSRSHLHGYAAMALVVVLSACGTGNRATTSLPSSAPSSAVDSSAVAASPDGAAPSSAVARSGGAPPRSVKPGPAGSAPARPVEPIPGQVTPIGDAANPPPPPESGFAPPPLEPSVGPVTPPPATGGSAPAVTVAGPTLDSRYQQTFGAFTGRRQCAIVVNERNGLGTALDVRLTTTFSDQIPTSPPAFAKYTPSASECFMADKVTILGPCTDGITLPPSTVGEPIGCLLGIEATGPDRSDFSGLLHYDLTAVCTSTAATPCSKVEQPEPTATAPVLVRWGYAVTLLACFAGPASETAPRCPDRTTVPTH